MTGEPIKVTVSVFNPDTGWVLPQTYVEQIREVDARFEVRVAQSRAELLKLLGDTQVLFGWALSEEEFRRHGKSLQWVQLTGASADTVLAMAAVRDSPVVITSASGVQRIQAAEHVLMMMLSMARRLSDAVRAQAERRWAGGQLTENLIELHEHKVGIIGLGEVGRQVAKLCKAFDMTVLGMKLHEEGQIPHVDRLYAAQEMDPLLAASDFVVVCVPPTAKTIGMIGKRRLRAMKQHAILVSISRGGVIDEDALAEALEGRAIGGAALDAFATEPPTSDSRLWKLPNCLMTPHLAGASSRYWQRATDLFCENLARFAAGSELSHVVDRTLGY